MDCKRRVVILYGSQTGSAQAVAERVFREAKRLHFQTKICAMDDFQPIGSLLEEQLAVFVCSTTGQGDTPSNMNKFWKFLLRKNLPSDSLDQLKFGVLGLGDSSYQKFNFVAKRLNKRLVQLGAENIVDLGLGDDQHDLGPDAVIDPWLKTFWHRALQLMPMPEGMLPIPANVRPPPRFIPNFDIGDVPKTADSYQKDLFYAKLSRCERLTDPDHFQDTRLVEFDCPPSLGRYEPGDVCMVQPSNLEENVATFFKLFPNLPHPDLPFSLEKRDQDIQVPALFSGQPCCTLRCCVETVFNLQAIPTRYFFELLSHFSPDTEDGQVEKEKLLEFSSAEGQEDLYDYCNRPRRHILEVLYDFRHTTPHVPFDYLFDLFPVIKPRAFSIASSFDRTPGKIELLVAVVSYRSRLLKAPRLGLCSNYLKRSPLGTKIPIWIEKGSLRFPPSPRPVVMVGPGTGISPFRAFALQQKTNERPMCVFFGCRSKFKDFYFKEDWERMSDQVTLIVAFSRDQEDKVYVQHLIKENDKLLADLLVEKSGCFYVAGNAKQMPDQVKSAVKSVISRHFKSEEKAEKFMAKMETEGRYQTETWS